MNRPYELCLGTAMWAWTISKKMAFSLLDSWYGQGQRCVDTATNYPINKEAADFRKAELWLKEWIEANGVKDLRIMVKIGSMSNDGSALNNLSPSFLSINHQHYTDLFGQQFDCMMLHWDNRSDKTAIEESVRCMEVLCKDKQSLGFSGIKHPEAYLPVLRSLQQKPFLQAKHNVFQSHLDYYKDLVEYTNIIAYGLSGGGIKLKEESYKNSSSATERNVDLSAIEKQVKDINNKLADFNTKYPRSSVDNMHQLGMLLASLDDRVSGLLIGPSKTAHIQDSLDFATKIEQHKEAYRSLKELIHE